MPSYDFKCARGHTVEKFFTIARVPAAVRCVSCRKRAGRLIAAVQCTGGLAMSEKSRLLYKPVFGGKAMREVHTAGDVDRKLSEFHARYPHLGHPGPMREVPRGVRLTDEKGMNE